MHNHSLRKFKSDDAAGVKELILRVLTKEYPFDRSAYSDSDLEKVGKTYGGERDSFSVADKNNSIVGTVGVKEESKDEALLRRLFVDSNNRRQGIGTELLEKAIEFCRSKGYRKILFRCTDRMSDAMRLCLKKGFKETEKLEIGGFKIHKLELSL